MKYTAPDWPKASSLGGTIPVEFFPHWRVAADCYIIRVCSQQQRQDTQRTPSMNPSNSLAPLLARFQPDPESTQSAAIQKTLFLASHLQQRIVALQTSAERRQQAELDRMLQHPEDKATLAMLTDQAFRPQTPRRVVDQFIHILKSQGIPRFFSPLQQTLLKGFQSFGGLRPGSRCRRPSSRCAARRPPSSCRPSRTRCCRTCGHATPRACG